MHDAHPLQEDASSPRAASTATSVSTSQDLVEHTHVSRTIATLAMAGIVAALTQTLVVPLIGDLPRMFDTDAAGATWIITITLLTAAVATPVAGRLGDMLGKRTMMLISLVPLIVGSAVCALATTLPVMIAGRALQGLAMGMVPLGIALLKDLVPKERVSSAISIMSSSMGVGGALGLPLAAGVAQWTDWRILFWGTAAAAVAIGVALLLLIGRGRPGTPARFDLLGAVLLAIGLVSLLLAISNGSSWGWASPVTLSLMGAAAVVLVAWGWWELRTPAALVDLRVAARRPVLLTNVASIMVGFAMYAQSLIVPQVLQLPVETGHGFGMTMFAMGLCMAPGGLAMMATSPIGGRITRRHGPKVTLILGSLVIAAGYASSLVALQSVVGIVVMSIVISGGVGLAYGAMPALIMGSVPSTMTAAANSLNSLMRSLGTTISGAVVGIVLAAMTTSFSGMEVPSADGFHIGMLIGCAMGVVAAAITFTVPAVRSSGAAH